MMIGFASANSARYTLARPAREQRLARRGATFQETRPEKSLEADRSERRADVCRPRLCEHDESSGLLAKIIDPRDPRRFLIVDPVVEVIRDPFSFQVVADQIAANPVLSRRATAWPISSLPSQVAIRPFRPTRSPSPRRSRRACASAFRSESNTPRLIRPSHLRQAKANRCSSLGRQSG